MGECAIEETLENVDYLVQTQDTLAQLGVVFEVTDRDMMQSCNAKRLEQTDGGAIRALRLMLPIDCPITTGSRRHTLR